MAGTFAERLNTELKERKRSGRWLAETMGINKMTVVRWRQGLHEPRQANIRAVAAALGVAVSALVDEAEAEAGSPEATPAAPPPPSSAEPKEEEAAVLVKRIAALNFQPTLHSLQQVVPDLMQVLTDAQEYARRHGE